MDKFLKFIWAAMVIILIICIGSVMGLVATILLPLFIILSPIFIAAIIWTFFS